MKASAATPFAPCLTFDALTLGYGRKPALRGLTGQIPAGTLLAVVGPNGSGKSTLLKGIAGVLRPMSGRCGVQAGAGVAYLPQRSELDCSFPAVLQDVVTMGLWPHRGLWRRHCVQDRARVQQAMSALGIADLAHRPLDALSGGQLQRALFARVLVQDAGLILLDEPFNGIDAQTADDLLCLVGQWHSQGRTVIAVLHDLDMVRAFFPDTLLLAGYPVAWGRTAGTLTAEHLRRAWGVGRFAAECLPVEVQVAEAEMPWPVAPAQGATSHQEPEGESVIACRCGG